MIFYSSFNQFAILYLLWSTLSMRKIRLEVYSIYEILPETSSSCSLCPDVSLLQPLAVPSETYLAIRKFKRKFHPTTTTVPSFDEEEKK